jgi:hypothetical protein
VAETPALEVLDLLPADEVLRHDGPALFTPPNGAAVEGEASIQVTRSSLLIGFEAGESFAQEGPAYGLSSGSIVAADGSWAVGSATYAGPGRNGEHLFDALAVTLRATGPGDDVVATRLVLAGAAWTADATIDGGRVVVRPLSFDVASHHDRRLSIAAAGVLDAAAIENLVRAASFVSGIELELLSVDRYDATGRLIEREHRRGLARIGRGPHPPFAAAQAAERARAFAALANALGPLAQVGVPLDNIVDQINASNVVRHIHLSAQLLALPIVTAAYAHAHGDRLDGRPATRGDDFVRLDVALALGLGAAARERYERLCGELLDAGFFHAPGYETGRPQRDIKFLRDIAHTIVLRLAGYAGPYHSSEFARSATLPPIAAMS